MKKFDEEHGLGFPWLPTRTMIAEAYGAWGEKSMYGKKTWGIICSSFLLDEKGKIAGAWVKVSPKDTVPKALEAPGGQTLNGRRE